MVFATGTAVGRVCMGISTGNEPRYAPYLLPFLVGLYLFLSIGVPRSWVRHLVGVSFLFAMLYKEANSSPEYIQRGEEISRFKRSFRECYLDTGALEYCGSRWPPHPDLKATQIEAKLFYLRERRLSLFRQESR